MLNVASKLFENSYVVPKSVFFSVNPINEDTKTVAKPINRTAMIVINSSQDIATSKSLEFEFNKHRQKYKIFKKIDNPEQFLIIDRKGNIVNVIQGNKNTDWPLNRYELGKLNSNLSSRVKASITLDGFLRFYKSDATSESMVTEIKDASLNFDNGISLNEVRIKLSNGQFVSLLSQVKGVSSVSSYH